MSVLCFANNFTDDDDGDNNDEPKWKWEMRNEHLTKRDFCGNHIAVILSANILICCTASNPITYNFEPLYNAKIARNERKRAKEKGKHDKCTNFSIYIFSAFVFLLLKKKILPL